MRQVIENCFPEVLDGDCLTVDTRYIFQVYDSENDPRRCYISQNETDEIHFTVENPDNQDVHFLAIDKCSLMIVDHHAVTLLCFQI